MGSFGVLFAFQEKVGAPLPSGALCAAGKSAAWAVVVSLALLILGCPARHLGPSPFAIPGSSPVLTAQWVFSRYQTPVCKSQGWMPGNDDGNVFPVFGELIPYRGSDGRNKTVIQVGIVVQHRPPCRPPVNGHTCSGAL
ncbi:hypothetical protein CB1_000335016 [Camelus ferus]|nr:hypothetical protein CB1_000335016 [Camelus ferus]